MGLPVSVWLTPGLDPGNKKIKQISRIPTKFSVFRKFHWIFITETFFKKSGQSSCTQKIRPEVVLNKKTGALEIFWIFQKLLDLNFFVGKIKPCTLPWLPQCCCPRLDQLKWGYDWRCHQLAPSLACKAPPSLIFNKFFVYFFNLAPPCKKYLNLSFVIRHQMLD